MEQYHLQPQSGLDLISLTAPLHPSPPPRSSPQPATYPRISPPGVDFNEKRSQHPDLSSDQRTHQSAHVRPAIVPVRSHSLPANAPQQTLFHSPRPTRLSQHNFISPALPSDSSAYAVRSFSQSVPYSRHRNLHILKLMKPWMPIILYALTSLGFVVAITAYKTELFEFLDDLSFWLRADEQYGQMTLFFLIFLTTIPPIPLYSTLIILSGYTFGPWIGAIISYFAALTGALFVFIVSRALLRDSISKWLSSYTRIKRVVRAIEKRPKLLFLIRLAPYPYNVMNCLLAASPTLTLHTYTVCTALSLFKVIIHTSLGSSIHSFRDYHVQPSGKNDEEDQSADMVARMWTGAGILMCVLILVYLSIVARRAVDEELEDEEPSTREDSEESMAFLSPDAAVDIEQGRSMAESPFRPTHIVPTQSLILMESEADARERWS